MKDDFKWLTGSDDIDKFAKKINNNNNNKKNIPTLRLELGDDTHCDEDIKKARLFFKKNGYIKVDRVFSDNEMKILEKNVTNAVELRFKDFNYIVNGNFYSSQFSQCLNLWEDSQEIRKIAFSKKLTRIAKSLLGVEKIRIWQDQALYKHPGGRNTSAHHDIPFWPLDNSECITAWIVLSTEGSTLENGALGYVPESHTSGLRHFSNITTGKSLDDFKKRDREILEHPLLKGKKSEYVEVERGSVVFHHGLTVHLSKPNNTNKIRKVYTVVYFKDGIKRGSQVGVENQKHFVVDRVGLKIKEGAIIDSELTPIAYPINKIPETPLSVSVDKYLESRGSLPKPVKLKSFI